MIDKSDTCGLPPDPVNTALSIIRDRDNLV